MNIRPVSQKDIEQIVSLVRSLANYNLDNPNSELPSWLEETLTENAFKARVHSADYLNFVYEAEGTVVGYISVKQPGYLYHLFVSEKYQGNGIARLQSLAFQTHPTQLTLVIQQSAQHSSLHPVTLNLHFIHETDIVASYGAGC